MPAYTQEELRTIMESATSDRSLVMQKSKPLTEIENDSSGGQQTADPHTQTQTRAAKEQPPKPPGTTNGIHEDEEDQAENGGLQASKDHRPSTRDSEPVTTDENGDVVMHDAQTEIETDEDDGSDEDAEAETADEVQEKSEAESSSESDTEEEDNDSSADKEPTIEVATENDDTDVKEGRNDEEASSSEEDEEEDEEDDDDDDDESHNKCAYCKEATIDSDKADEVFLTCKKCGETRAHKSCAKSEGNLDISDQAAEWQCHDCADGPNSRSPEHSSSRRKNTAPRLVRDLLPVSRGVQKPNSHSIFAHPLISEGEEGGRSLRKRKSPTSEPPPSEKRVRKATPKAMSIALAEEESVAHATRRASQKLVPTARVLQHRPPHKPPPHKFILAFRLDQTKIEKILNKPPKPGRRRDRRRPPKIPPPPIFQAPIPKFPALPTNHLIFPSMWGDRENEINAKPYGGILTEQEADTSRSLPQLRDREVFERARQEAEEERRKTSAAAEAEINGENANVSKPNRTVSGPPSKIKCIQFGKHVIDTFYAAPYPEEYSHESRLFICEFCLKYLPSEFVAYRHKLKCPAKHPPGDEIYREGSISIWEVDGRKKTEYCQCLCLMAKMFLGSKTLYYDVEPFLFYILTEYDEFGYHFVGYFSKEKRPASQNNVSCILVMPIHQRKGYATFLIDFSYLLTRIEGKDGSPEKPLSDMGLTAYRSYWDLTISRQLLEIGLSPFSTKDLMQRTGMTADDVIHSLERLYAFIRDPVTKVYAIRYDKQLYESIVQEYESKKHRDLKPDNLVWTPYIMGRSDQAQLESQPMQTVAPREDDEEMVDEQSLGPPELSQSQQISDEGVSPKSVRASSQGLPAALDPQLVNGLGHVAPGPPTTEALTLTSMPDIPLLQVEGEPVVNGEKDEEPTEDLKGVTGYALAFRQNKIPPNRFQIDPPIPTSMLRARLNKRRSTVRPRPSNVSLDSTAPAPTRSSPRHAASINGSVGDPTSPEKASTPVRRSNRKSGLVNMEVAVTDGSADEEEDPHDEIEANTMSKKRPDGDDEDEEEQGDESSSEEDEEDNDAAVQSASSESEDELQQDVLNADAQSSGEEDDEDDEEVVEEEEEEEEEDEEVPPSDDDDDPDAEIDEDEEDDDEEEEGDDD